MSSLWDNGEVMGYFVEAAKVPAAKSLETAQ